MAVDTSIPPLGGAPEAGAKIEVFQRDVDFSVDNLASGAWFELFDTSAGDVVLGGTVEIVEVDAGGGKLQLGTGGGTDLTGPLVIATAQNAALSLVKPAVGAGPVTIAASVAAVTTARVKVSLAVLKAGDFSG